MSDEQILDIPLQLSSAGVSGVVLIQWHGGEPLLIDPFRVEELIVELTSIVYATGINFSIVLNLLETLSIICSRPRSHKMFQHPPLLLKVLL
jgi:sulfatase maturation enzyme AslB (radical SAM superfamily)